MKKVTLADLSPKQISALKRKAVGDKPYADRISLQFFRRLTWLRVESGEDHLVIHELDHLEHLHSKRSRTKPETQFRHPRVDLVGAAQCNHSGALPIGLHDSWTWKASDDRSMMGRSPTFPGSLGRNPHEEHLIDRNERVRRRTSVLLHSRFSDG
jgi:hypothetical protein